MAVNNMAHVRAKMGLEGVGDVVDIRCPSCPFVAVSHAQFSVHALGHLQDRRPAGDQAPARRPPPFRRPSIGTCCKPADWANFMSAWERYKAGSSVQQNVEVYEFIECLSEELRTSVTHAYPDILTMGIDDVVRSQKAPPSLSASEEVKPCNASRKSAKRSGPSPRPSAAP